MSQARWNRVLGAGVVAAALLSTSLAGAQTEDAKAGARAAAMAGGKAFVEKRWPEAIDFFTRAESLVHSPVHLLYIARAQVQVGALVKARENYIRISNEPVPVGAPPQFTAAKGDAEKEMQALEPRIPQVTIQVSGAGPNAVTITQDGMQIPAALIGIPRPVDPGSHKFQAYAQGLASPETPLQIAEGRSETVVLALQPSTAAPPIPVGTPAPQPPPQQPVQAPPPAQQPPPEKDEGPSGMRIGAYVALGVGGVGLIGGTVFAFLAKSARDEANDKCKFEGLAADECPTDVQSEVKDLDDSGDSRATLATVGFVVGALGVGTGVTLLVLSMGGEEKSASAEVHPWVGLGSAGLAGKF